jgi:hypothetical protein
MSNHTSTELAQELAESRSEFLRNIPNFTSPQRESTDRDNFLQLNNLYLGTCSSYSS